MAFSALGAGRRRARCEQLRCVEDLGLRHESSAFRGSKDDTRRQITPSGIQGIRVQWLRRERERRPWELMGRGRGRCAEFLELLGGRGAAREAQPSGISVTQ